MKVIMKNIKILSIFTLIIMMIVMTCTTIVYATDSFSLDLIADKTTLHPGDTVQLQIKLNNLNIESGEQGIGAYSGKLLYNADIFDFVSITSDKWEVMQNEGKIIANTKDANVVTAPEVTATVKLQVKENATEGATEVELTQIQGSAPDTIEGVGSKVELTIAKVTTQEPGKEPGKENDKKNEVGNTNTPGGNQQNQASQPNKSNTAGINTYYQTSDKELPKAGIMTILAPIAFVGLIIAVVSFIKYQKYKDIK